MIRKKASAAAVAAMACLPFLAQAQVSPLVQQQFLVLLTIEKSCSLTAPANIDLGTHPSSATNVSGTTTFSVTCSNTTPYTLGLSPTGSSTTGAGNLITSPATDSVPYQLYKPPPAAAGAVWGNTGTALVSGVGTGSAESYTVTATVPSLNFTPGNYQDTVVVTLGY